MEVIYFLRGWVGGGHKFLYHNRDDKNTGEDMNMYCTIAITNPFLVKHLNMTNLNSFQTNFSFEYKVEMM